MNNNIYLEYIHKMPPYQIGRIQQQNEKGYKNQQVDLPKYRPPVYRHGKEYPFRDVKAINQHYLHNLKPIVTKPDVFRKFKVVNPNPYNKAFGNPEDIKHYEVMQGEIVRKREQFKTQVPDNERLFTTQRPEDDAVNAIRQKLNNEIPPRSRGRPPGSKNKTTAVAVAVGGGYLDTLEDYDNPYEMPLPSSKKERKRQEQKTKKKK